MQRRLTAKWEEPEDQGAPSGACPTVPLSPWLGKGRPGRRRAGLGRARVSESVTEVRNTASESAVAQRSPGCVTCLGETIGGCDGREHSGWILSRDHAG